jgi:hypothetical protein
MIIENRIGSKDKYDKRTDSHKSLLSLNYKLVEDLWRDHPHRDNVDDVILVDDVSELPKDGPHQVHVDLPNEQSSVEATSSAIGVDLWHRGSGIQVQPDVDWTQSYLQINKLFHIFYRSIKTPSRSFYLKSNNLV